MQRFLDIKLPCQSWKSERILWVGLVLIGLVGCKTDYEKLVDRELKRGVRQDSIYLGIRMGMSSKEFYAHCWELNKRRVIRQGSRNISVMYTLTELRDTAEMNFYPSFERDSIYEMPTYVSYHGWAPWNTQLSPDTLLVDVVKMLKKWHGGSFLRLNYPDVGTVFVKVDGNRRIVVSREGESQVKVIYTDLLVEKRRKEKADE